MEPSLTRCNAMPMTAHSITSSTSNQPNSRKHSREKGSKEATDAKCKNFRKVIINKEVVVREFHTQDVEPPVIRRMSSTQSSGASSTSTLIDEESQADEDSQVDNPPPKKRRMLAKTERTATAVQLFSRNQAIQRKTKTYPKKVPKTQEKRTQWIDPLKTDKEMLCTILYQTFLTQRPDDWFKIPDSITKQNVCKVIQFVSDKIMEYLKNRVKREEFLNQDSKDFENFLKDCVVNYTLEEGLDKETFKLIQSKSTHHRIPEQSSYTYKMLRDTEREQILASIPLFLSNEDVKVQLENLFQQFSAESV